MAAYLATVHSRLIDAGFWREVERDSAAQGSVAVACGLEGLADALVVVEAAGRADEAAGWRDCLCTGLACLLRLQCIAGGAPRERGGFGFTTPERAQRIDITGHAASAFMKLATLGLDCPAPEG